MNTFLWACDKAKRKYFDDVAHKKTKREIIKMLITYNMLDRIAKQ